MSWGGAETVALARELGEQKIPVLLTIQVDSVTKVGQNDAVIPANVAEAANFYQTEGFAARAGGDSRGGPSEHADPGKLSDRVWRQDAEVRELSLVRPGVREISHGD